MTVSHDTNRKRFSINFILVVICAALFSAFVGGYLLGVKQAVTNPSAPKKTARLNFGPIHFVVSADALGLIIISLLGILLLVSGLLAILAFQRRKRVLTVEKEAAETRQRLATIVESSEDAIISKTLDGTITSWNRGAEALYGYSAADMVGQPMTRLFPVELVNEEAGILARIARGEVVDPFETVRIDKQRRPIEISTRISPLADSDGKIVGAANIARDITERKQAERRLQAQLVRLDLLQQITRAMDERQDMESIFQVVSHRLVADLPLDFCCVCLVDAAVERVSVVSIAVQTPSLAEQMALPEQTPIDIKANGLSHFILGKLVYEPDITRVTLPSPEHLVRAGLRSLVVTPLLVEGKVFGILVAARREADNFSSGECEFLRQLSEHVALAAHQAQLYLVLQKAYDDLRQTQLAVMQQERLRALGQMASGIAHDINNAISPMMLYTESLLETEQNLSPRGRKGLKVIERAVDDVSATVARLSEFYRQREPQLALTRLELGPLLPQVLDLTRARWSDMPQKRGVVIEAQIDSAARLPAIMGVESEIREALTNLVLNAVDAMPEGGKLVLRTRVTNGEGQGETRDVQVEVSDSGTGMDEETRRRCLEPFFTTKGERGTGLGLAMVYGIAERHGAEVEIESEVGRGTTVRLCFASAAATADRSGQTAAELTVLAPQRILVVDDDAVVLKTLTDVLLADGHFVVAANGGKQGIDAFTDALEQGKAFDMVVTDLGMPYVDGHQVAGAIKKTSPSTPVILFSGWGQRFATEKELPPNIDQVLSKPPKLRDLRQALINCSLLLDRS